MPKIKINTFGIGIEIRKLRLDPETYEHWSTIAVGKNQLLPDLVIDPFFYYDLKDKRFSQLSDIDAVISKGMTNTPKSHIEIWFNRKKVLKIKSFELFDTMVLFPLFQIKKTESFANNTLEKGIYTTQKTVGLLRTQEIEINAHHLNIDDFTFHLSEFENNKFLTEIKYHNQNLNFVKKDEMITYQTAFEIK